MKKLFLIIAVLFIAESSVFCQQNLNNTVWVRSLPEHGIEEFLHLIGQNHACLLTIVGQSKTVSTGYYLVENNMLMVDFFGLDRKFTISPDQVSAGKFTYRKFSGPYPSNGIAVKKSIELFDPFTKKQAMVSKTIPEKYYGEYVMDGTWKTKIVLTKEKGKSIHWKQSLKPGSRMGNEFIWSVEKDLNKITWGFLQEKGKNLLTNPIISASINNHKYNIFEGSPILVFDLGDNTSSYCFVVEDAAGIYLIYNWSVFKKQ